MSSILSVDKFYSKPLKHDVNLRSKLDQLARIEASEEEKQYQVLYILLPEPHPELDDVRSASN